MFGTKIRIESEMFECKHILEILHPPLTKITIESQMSKTRNQIILTKQSGRVPKILTASKILQISIALCQIKAKIHSFPTMYIIGGGKFGLTRWKKCLKPKRSPKNSCFGGNESQLHNFGRVWDPNFLRWPQFGGYPRKATCLSFKMSYVQGP